MKHILQHLIVILMLVAGSHALPAGLPMLEHLAGDRVLPATFGIGIDYFGMEQDYDIESLTFTFPNLVIPDLSVVDVENDIDYVDIRFDAWIFPFLNAFGIIGKLDGKSVVDLGRVQLPQPSAPLGIINIDYDGTVYGAGFTAVMGGKQWFASLTATYTDSSLDGDFSSSVKTISLQPKLGWRYFRGEIWLGVTYLDAEETHSGVVSLGIPMAPPVPFNVELDSSEKLNYNVGARLSLAHNLETSIELGFADRKHGLVNLTRRF